MKTIDVRTSRSQEFLNITHEIRKAVQESGVKDGIVLVYIPHTTAAVTINEAADPDVVRDIITTLNDMIPVHGNYHHSEGNSHAHIKSSMIGCSTRIIVKGGELILGTWQGIFFCEFDGPRSRHVHVEITGK